MAGLLGTSVLLQYTALGWSRRGFPLRFLQVLRHNGARSVIVFHDALPYGGSRLIDRLRRACQLWVMRTAYRRADRSVLPVLLDQVTWLPPPSAKAAFIPIGANLPLAATNPGKSRASHRAKTVAVYGVTGEPATLSEVRDISHVLKLTRAQVGNLRLVVFGRGSAEAERASTSCRCHQLRSSAVRCVKKSRRSSRVTASSNIRSAGRYADRPRLVRRSVVPSPPPRWPRPSG